MAQYIQVKGDIVEFPDGMSDADIASAIKKNMMSISPSKQKAEAEDPGALGTIPIPAGKRLIVSLMV